MFINHKTDQRDTVITNTEWPNNEVNYEEKRAEAIEEAIEFDSTTTNMKKSREEIYLLHIQTIYSALINH